MGIKILHAADFHMDSPFEALETRKAVQRRAEQRELLGKLAEMVNENGVQLVLLPGDLLDSAASYHETHETLLKALGSMRAKVFIAPGNHDYLCPASPYEALKFPENVTVFRSTALKPVMLPELNARVWGAAFHSSRGGSFLRGFSIPESSTVELMVLHGETVGDNGFGPPPEKLIAESNLDYLALGHIHSFSGINKAGNTYWAYPGCPEGRGFDETGSKGVLLGEVDKGRAELRFVPMGGREYSVNTVALTPETEPLEAVLSLLPEDAARHIYRFVFTGEHTGALPLEQIRTALSEKVYALDLKDETREPRDIWDGMDNDSLRGLFLTGMKARYDAADEAEKQQITMAVRYAAAALENREAAR